MTRFILVVGALAGLSELTPARAQFVVGPLYGPGYGYGYGGGYSYRGGFGFSVGGPRFRVKGFSGGFVSRSAFFAPPFGFAPVGPVGFGPAPFAGFGPFGPVLPVGPFGFSPAFWNGWGFGNPAFFNPGFNPGWNGLGFGPQVIIVPQPIIIGGNFGNPNADALGGNIPPRNDAVVLPRGAREADFLVISPKKATTVPEVTRVADVRPPGPVIAFDPFKVPVKVKAERPEADPKKEAARLADLGRASFAAGDYGRAAEHFERAIAANPEDARNYFLQAQARFATGQYAEAVAGIRDGLARDAKWPGAAFDPNALYGARADGFATHLGALKKAVADNPGQATLEFLLGYELWFSGEKEEAAKLFRAAEKRLAAPGPIALFK